MRYQYTNPTLEQLEGAHPKKLPTILRMRSPVGKVDHYVERGVWHVVNAKGEVLAGGKVSQVGYKSDKPVFKTKVQAQDWIEHKTKRALARQAAATPQQD